MPSAQRDADFEAFLLDLLHAYIWMDGWMDEWMDTWIDKTCGDTITSHHSVPIVRTFKCWGGE